MLVELRLTERSLILVGPGVAGEERQLEVPDLGRLRGHTAAYRRLLGATNREAQLLGLGRELYRWLEGRAGWLTRLRRGLVPPFALELRAQREPSVEAWAVLNAPWELLAGETGGLLAQDAHLGFSVARRLGEPLASSPLPDWRLGLVFMAAAAPRDQVELDHEKEGNAILAAAGGLGLDLVVEDSGNPHRLAERLGGLADLPVLRLSCHGTDAPPQPALARLAFGAVVAGGAGWRALGRRPAQAEFAWHLSEGARSFSIRSVSARQWRAARASSAGGASCRRRSRCCAERITPCSQALTPHHQHHADRAQVAPG